ncbi:MAG: rRNA (cytidine1920-2-O)/16S rRNA (cytidine1409-2-O)-methyltransferase [Actinomycetota bacterium]|nr:rRNA (cytidine1920-2-O)/16S rRNA (cytidine1409-2-O)-methyltransferase [Actinomycetota bacterium]
MTVQGIAAPSPATLVAPDVAIEISGPARRFVSRGGEKLDGALERLDVSVTDKRWLDAGASTGGFTDRLLQGGAAAVAAVDVGYGQLDWGLRNDPRVTVLERTNVRSLTASDLPWRPDGVVADLSFISLTTVLPALAAVAADDADWLLMVKPQFEVGREGLAKGGVVRDRALWLQAIEKVVGAAEAVGLGLVGAAPSPLTGPAGNREFFVHLRRGPSKADVSLATVVEDAP